MTVEFGDFNDNFSVLLVAQRLTATGDPEAAANLLDGLVAHIQDSNDVQSQRLLMPPAVGQLAIALVACRTRTVANEQPVHAPKRHRRGARRFTETAVLRWALRVCLVMAIGRFVWHDVAPVLGPVLRPGTLDVRGTGVAQIDLFEKISPCQVDGSK